MSLCFFDCTLGAAIHAGVTLCAFVFAVNLIDCHIFNHVQSRVDRADISASPTGRASVRYFPNHCFLTLPSRPLTEVHLCRCPDVLHLNFRVRVNSGRFSPFRRLHAMFCRCVTPVQCKTFKKHHFGRSENSISETRTE